MKTAVVYWSGTGNTEAMARAVAEGMTAAGAEAVLAGIEHRLELHFLQHLTAHSGAAEGDGVVGVQIAGCDLGGREQHRLCTRGGHALGNGPCHRLRIARTAPINNSSFHFRKFLSLDDFI